jgi:hypothetical protein
MLLKFYYLFAIFAFTIPANFLASLMLRGDTFTAMLLPVASLKLSVCLLLRLYSDTAISKIPRPIKTTFIKVSAPLLKNGNTNKSEGKATKSRLVGTGLDVKLTFFMSFRATTDSLWDVANTISLAKILPHELLNLIFSEVVITSNFVHNYAMFKDLVFALTKI